MTSRRVIALACLCAGLVSVTHPVSGQSATLSATSLNFGKVVVGTVSTSKLITVKNSGLAQLVFSGISAPSGFAQTNNCTQLAPGAKCTITVTFAPSAYITYNGTLTIYDNAGSGTQTVTLQGTGVLPVRVPSSLSFTAVVGTTSPVIKDLLINYQTVLLNITNLAIVGPFNLSSGTTCSTQVTAQSSCTLAISYTATAATQQTGSLTVTHDASNSPSTIALVGWGTAVALTSVVVSPNPATVPKGMQQQFVATGYYNNNTTQDLTGTASWASSVPSVASVSNSGTKGLATALSQGSTTITATSGTIKGSANLSVSAPSLVSIAVSPATSTLPLGTTKQFTATGTYSDGTSTDLTSAVGWQSSNPSAATVSVTGLATGIAQGSATISATYGGVSGSALLTIAPAALLSIAVTPPNPSIALGTQQQFLATGTYTDGSTLDLTQQVAWSSSSGAATISNTSSSQGLAQSTAVGSATVTATLDSITGTALLSVTPAALVSITISPVNPTIAQGLKQQFTAIGTFTDNSTQDITATVAWNSSMTSVASISNAAGNQGQASALSPGLADITANSGTVGSNVAIVTIQPPVLLSITITPRAPFLAVGTTQQLTATGNYSDGSTQDLTASVIWSSFDPSVADVSNTAGTQGALTASATGTVTISSTSGSITDNDVVVVTPAAISSITINPGSASIPLGTTQQFAAIATFSDGTTQDVTSTVYWTAGDGSVATVSNSAPNAGLASTVAQGTVTITATAGGVSANASLLVNAAALVSIVVAPANASIPLGGSQQFTAMGVYSDQSTQHLTAIVTWDSSPGGFANISNAPGTQGQAIGVAQGATTVIATQGSISGSTALTVSQASLVSIAVNPGTSAIPLGASQQFTASAYYSDNSTQDLTSSVTWTAVPSGVVSISNAPGTQGQAIGLSQGTTTITAAQGSVSGNATLGILPPALTSISITPSPANIYVGLTQQFTATATYTDGSVQDVTNAVAWSSSVSNAATISSGGMASGVASGSTTIYAALGSIVAWANATIVASLPVPSNFRADISVGTTGQLFVSWNPVTGATYYNLQRSTNSGTGYFSVIACSGMAGNNHTQTFSAMRVCRDPNLAVGATYYYEVQACSSNGCSDYSRPVSNIPVFSDCTPAQMPDMTGAQLGQQVALLTKMVDPTATFMPNNYQYAGYARQNVLYRNVLVVTLPGSGSTCGGFGPFAIVAKSLGFDVLCVNYSNKSSQTNICVGDPDCFGNVSQAKLDATGSCSVALGAHCGKDPFTGQPYVNSNPADAITQRISMMLQYLNNNGYSTAGTNWGSYLSGSSPRWDHIIIGGWSQGGSMGTFTGYQHLVARVFNLSAPPEATLVSKVMTPATYFGNPKATDIRNFFGLVSTYDTFYTQGNFSAAWQALGFTSTNNDAEMQLNTASPLGLSCNSGLPSHNFSTSGLVSPSGAHSDPTALWNEDVFKFMLLD